MTKKFLLLASVLGGFYTASSQVSFTSGDVKATLGTRFMADIMPMIKLRYLQVLRLLKPVYA